MKQHPIFLHACYTWLVAILLYPAMVFCIAAFVHTEPRFFFHPDVIWVYVDILITSLPYSFPGLLAGWICLELISHTNLQAGMRFGIWLSLAVLVAALGAMLIHGFSPVAAPQKLVLVLPCVLAVGIAVLLRRRPFKKIAWMYRDRTASAEMS